MIEIIKIMKEIVEQKQYQKVKFSDNKELLVDLQTANKVCQAFDQVKPETQEKITERIKSSVGFLKLVSLIY